MECVKNPESRAIKRRAYDSLEKGHYIWHRPWEILTSSVTIFCDLSTKRWCLHEVPVRYVNIIVKLSLDRFLLTNAAWSFILFTNEYSFEDLHQFVSIFVLSVQFPNQSLCKGLIRAKEHDLLSLFCFCWNHQIAELFIVTKLLVTHN